MNVLLGLLIIMLVALCIAIAWMLWSLLSVGRQIKRTQRSVGDVSQRLATVKTVIGAATLAIGLSKSFAARRQQKRSARHAKKAK